MPTSKHVVSALSLRTVVVSQSLFRGVHVGSVHALSFILNDQNVMLTDEHINLQVYMEPL